MRATKEKMRLMAAKKTTVSKKTGNIKGQMYMVANLSLPFVNY